MTTDKELFERLYYRLALATLNILNEITYEAPKGQKHNYELMASGVIAGVVATYSQFVARACQVQCGVSISESANLHVTTAMRSSERSREELDFAMHERSATRERGSAN